MFLKRDSELLFPWNFHELKNYCNLDYSALRNPKSEIRNLDPSLCYRNASGGLRFVSDMMLHDAVLRRLMIVTEAAGRLSNDLVLKFPQIPFSKIRGLRNLIVHDYDGVNLGAIWEIVTEKIPEIHMIISEFLEE